MDAPRVGYLDPRRDYLRLPGLKIKRSKTSPRSDEVCLKVCEVDPATSNVNHWDGGYYGYGPKTAAPNTRGPVMYPLVDFATGSSTNFTQKDATPRVRMYLKRLLLRYQLIPSQLSPNATAGLLNRICIIYDRGLNNPNFMDTSGPTNEFPFSIGGYLNWLSAIFQQSQFGTHLDLTDYPFITTMPNFVTQDRFLILYDETQVLPSMAGAAHAADIEAFTVTTTKELTKLIDIDLEGLMTTFEDRTDPLFPSNGYIQGQLYFFVWNNDPFVPNPPLSEPAWRVIFNARITFADGYTDEEKGFKGLY